MHAEICHARIAGQDKGFAGNRKEETGAASPATGGNKRKPDGS
jgi:hypothetical protein